MYVNAEPHHLAVYKFLIAVFLEQWIGQGGPTAWPACTLGLNNLNFYLQGHLNVLFMLQ
jgi:hypothetical protein